MSNIRTLRKAFKVIIIKGNPKNEIDRKEVISRKMPVFNCSCGTKSLIVPDLDAMNKAIESHLIIHKKLTGHPVTQETLTEEILTIIIETVNAT